MLGAAPDAPVVVGFDGSKPSLSAVRIAAREAALHGRALRVVHSFNWVPDPQGPPHGELREPAERLTASAVGAGTSDEPDLEVSSALVEGPADIALLRESGAAALLAIGDGRPADQAWAPIAATALSIAARAGCTVLVARETPPAPGPVLVGIDGSTASEAALGFAVDEAARRSADLVVIRTWEQVDPRAGSGNGMAALLADTVAPWQHRYPQVTIHQEALTGNPKSILVEHSGDAELVVASARGEQPWRGMLGGVSQALLYHSPAPVAIVRRPHELYVQA